jgi:signal transduction histidine kinase
MLIRYKFGVLALIYAVALIANLALATWCISVYFRSSFGDYESAVAGQATVERLWRIVREQREIVADAGAYDEPERLHHDLSEEIASLVSELDDDAGLNGGADGWEGTRRDIVAAQAAAVDYLGSFADPEPGGRVSRSQALGRFDDIDRRIGALSRKLSLERQAQVGAVASTQDRVLSILVLNAALALVLCGAGVALVRRWVIRPVVDLREATETIARGDFTYRVHPRSSDEMGQLAEKMTTAAETVAFLAHNVRNPLAGLRALAEETAHRHRDDPQTLECQQRIIEAVDRYEAWFRNLQDFVSPVEISPARVCIDTLVGDAVKALQPFSEQCGVNVECRVAPDVRQVKVDSLHMGQALVALLTNAIQASPRGKSVHVRIRPRADTTHGEWELTVSDDGPGIPPKLRERVFLPRFTTKPGGSGLGLAVAKKVITSHGGRLTIESGESSGTRVTVTMPGLVAET